MLKWGSVVAISLSLCASAIAQAPPLVLAAAHVPNSQAPMQFLCGVQAPYGEWDSLAKFVAGMGTDGYSLTDEQRAGWNHHAEVSNTSWAMMQSRYLNRIDTWRKHTFDKHHADVAFYPFSGPDAANILTFFPDARDYELIGLEPVGCVPAGLADYTPRYFSALRRSLDAIVTLGFFRTNDMQRDFNEDNLRGVLPALLFMISRSGYSVQSVTPTSIFADGSIDRPRDGVKTETAGVEIQFRNATSSRRLRYFSLNLQDGRLERKRGTLKYLGNLPESDTLIKSASYLMHHQSFSLIRNTILTKSRLIIEDDSGIPYRFFDSAAWDVRLHGVYSDPIALFANWRQDDLKLAFTSRKEALPLDFAIGYKHVKDANLLVAWRRGK
jgi:hypothetical protein